MSMDDGVIIILSYPDTVVRPAYTEFSSKIWPKIGVGSKDAVQAGHAALLLIKKRNQEILYFDFGRYITTFGYGRVRSKETDPELEIPITAKFDNDKLSNLKEILLWIEAHPEKTHGDGRLVSGLHSKINYQKALVLISDLIDKKEIPYGAFLKKGTNCARFVTDTLIAATTDKRVKRKLKTSNLFTPSPIGNVIKATNGTNVYTIYKQVIKNYNNSSILKEYGTTFLNKFDTAPNVIGTEKPNSAIFHLENGTWLGGIGSGAWFAITNKTNTEEYKIARYTSLGKKDFEGIFICESNSFNFEEKYEFKHPSNCVEVFLEQNNSIFKFSLQSVKN